MRELKEQIRECVVKQTNLVKDISDEEIKQLIDGEIFKREECRGIAVWDKIQLHRDIFNSLRGLDVLQDLVEDSSITEIMINGVEDIFIEQAGKIHRLDKQFSSKEKLEDVVQQIVSKANRIVNEASPIVDTRLEDGSRVNIVLPPVALNNGPIVTIRKFPEKAIDMGQLIAMNSITEEAARFMEQLVKAGMNIFISGGTGSGKTTFLNILSNAIPKDERIITIEDSAELQIRKIPNLVKLETRNANVEGKNAITIRELIKCALRMRPDRIIVGEVRDAAAIDMLTALNTGHDGSLSTGHANSPEDMLSRLETLVLMGMDIPLEAVRRQIASAIEIIVHLGRLRDKSRRVLQIVEVLQVENRTIVTQPLFEFVEEGEDARGRVLGTLQPTKYCLQQTEKLQRAGITL
ncbi:MAG: CpaF family protein [Lachnospiraceae bacterium]|jgi:pilus assembly protein CpaF|nr:CpaF family protein [Lachnospiraceae bacterium]